MKKNQSSIFRFASISLILLIFSSINTVFTQNSSQNTEGGMPDSTYIKDIQTWHQQRIKSLKSESGWLNLAGLFWLKEGRNTFGSDESNAIVFPKGAYFLGQFMLKDGEVSVKIAPKAKVTVNNKPISSLKIFPSKETVILESGSLRWFTIKRGEKYGIRLRDLESPAIQHFTDIETYPIAPNWRVKARLETTEKDKKIAITDVLGQTNMQPSPGTLVFSVEGKEYRLAAIDEGNELFIIFKDETSSQTTYGAGRFLYAEKPNPHGDGTVYLDFNKAINPPCAFTDFATCPLAPRQNWLPISVLAGEKKYAAH